MQFELDLRPVSIARRRKAAEHDIECVFDCVIFDDHQMAGLIEFSSSGVRCLIDFFNGIEWNLSSYEYLIKLWNIGSFKRQDTAWFTSAFGSSTAHFIII